MSSSAYLSGSSTPLFSDNDCTGKLTEDDKLSTAVMGSSGGSTCERGSGWARAHPMRLSLVAEDMEGVLELQQISQVEVMADMFARVLGQAQGPPTLEWCLNQALCTLCAWQGEAYKFDEPSAGS
ncbi:hypothetical protein E4T56_gene262 [Termitomyces sp. T112]|nr:hypothetical protein E4T56_gene262 [Termitomyces sp. T112]